MKGEIYPSHCAKCRSRKWDSGAPTESKQSTPQPTPISSLEDRKAVALAALESVAHRSTERELGALPEPVVTACSYTERVEDTGETYACGLQIGHRGKHSRGRRLSA